MRNRKKKTHLTCHILVVVHRPLRDSRPDLLPVPVEGRDLEEGTVEMRDLFLLLETLVELGGVCDAVPGRKPNVVCN